MGIFSKFLTTVSPRNGRMVKEDGSVVNEADVILGTNPSTQQKVQISDRYGRTATVSSAGEQLIGSRIDNIAVNFQYGVSSDDVVNVNDVSGTGHVGQIGSMATVNTGAGVGSATLQSKSAVRYRSGHESYCSPSVVFASPEENVNQYAGFLNGEDGLCLGFQGLNSGFWFIEGGNFNFYPQTSWNIDPMDGTGPSGYTLNMLAGQVPEIKFIWHGLRNITLEIISDTGESYPCHVLKFINVDTLTHLENPSLPVSVKIERTSGTGSDMQIRTGSWRAGVVAVTEDPQAGSRWKNVTRLDATLVGSVRNNIFTVRNKATYQGKTNHIIYELGIVTFTSDANKTVAVYGAYGATLSGNSAYQDVDTLNCPLEFSTGGTVSGGSRGPATVIKAGQDRRTDVRGTGIFIYPNQTLTFEVDPNGPVTGTFSIAARFVGRH